MVSLWPFGREDVSPASFEKVLSALSAKINRCAADLETKRSRGRRLRALWTLYASFTYLLFLIVASLVIGWREWTLREWSITACAPLFIYGIRRIISIYHDYVTASLQSRLDALQKQRDETVTRLKAATKYDTTQQLLQRYGGSPSDGGGRRGDQGSRKTSQSKRKDATSTTGRTTGFAPPPTANIPRPSQPMSLPNTPQRGSQEAQSSYGMPLSASLDGSNFRNNPSLAPSHAGSRPSLEPTAEFAPNAFAGPAMDSNAPGAYQPPLQSGNRHWYDRLMDVLLGDDETAARNRLALICRRCRRVNGQAPPGVKSLEDVGTWRCSSCDFLNDERPALETPADPLRASHGSLSPSRTRSPDLLDDSGSSKSHTQSRSSALRADNNNDQTPTSQPAQTASSEDEGQGDEEAVVIERQGGSAPEPLDAAGSEDAEGSDAPAAAKPRRGRPKGGKKS